MFVVENDLRNLLSNQTKRLNGRKLNVLDFVAKKGHQLEERSVDENLWLFFGKAEEEEWEGSNAGLSVLPVVCVDGVGSKGKYFGFELFRIFWKDWFESRSRSLADSIGLIVIFLNETKILKQHFH